MFTAMLVLVLALVVGILAGALLSSVLGIEEMQAPTIVFGNLAIVLLLGIDVYIKPVFIVVGWWTFNAVLLLGFAVTLADNLVHALPLRRKKS